MSVDNSPDDDDFVGIQFETKYLVPDPVCCLAVCGSIQDIGNWDVQHAVTAEERPTDSGNWIVMILLPTSVNIEWKWVVLHRQTRHVIRWEERYNRWFHTGYQNGRILAPWNRAHTFCPVPSGVQWDEGDTKQLDELIHCLENETNEAEQSNLPLQQNTPGIVGRPGILGSLVQTFVRRFWRWYNFLQTSFRNLLQYLYSTVS